jgi:hypothetical protein
LKKFILWGVLKVVPVKWGNQDETDTAELVLYCRELGVQVEQAVVIGWNRVNVAVNQNLF